MTRDNERKERTATRASGEVKEKPGEERQEKPEEAGEQTEKHRRDKIDHGEK